MRELIAKLEAKVSSLQNDFEQAEHTSKQKFVASIGDQDFTERKVAASIMVKAASRYFYGERVIGNYRGFDIVQNGSFLYIKGDDCYSINVNEEKPESVFASIDGILRNLDRRLEGVQLELDSYRSNVAKVEHEIGKTFKDEALLLEKQRDLDEVMARLSAFNKEQAQAA
jgi:LPS O-antigen subunit length determinant protein (WzzB/FepE family)